MLETHQAVKSQRADIIVDQRHDSFLAPIYPCLAKRSEATGHCSTCQSNHLRNPANLQPRSGTCFELWCKDSLLSAKFVTLSHVSVVELHTYTYEVCSGWTPEQHQAQMWLHRRSRRMPNPTLRGVLLNSIKVSIQNSLSWVRTSSSSNIRWDF